MKTYAIIVSEHFPATHTRAGEPTGFIDNILNGEKKHTIRGNYPFWKKRFESIEDGEAVLSIRKWSGKPYRSPQIEIARLDASNGIGLQLLTDIGDGTVMVTNPTKKSPAVRVPVFQIAKNDGLPLEDFKKWFERYAPLEPMVIIHFSDFRYS